MLPIAASEPTKKYHTMYFFLHVCITLTYYDTVNRLEIIHLNGTEMVRHPVIPFSQQAICMQRVHQLSILLVPFALLPTPYSEPTKLFFPNHEYLCSEGTRDAYLINRKWYCRYKGIQMDKCLNCTYLNNKTCDYSLK